MGGPCRRAALERGMKRGEGDAREKPGGRMYAGWRMRGRGAAGRGSSALLSGIGHEQENPFSHLETERNLPRPLVGGRVPDLRRGHGGGSTSVEMRYEDENLWLTQKMMATLYDVSVPAISQHLKRVFADNELDEAAVVKPYLTTAADGKNYQVKHYSLQAIIAVGFKIENERA